MAKLETGESHGHTHTIDTDEESGLTSEDNGHTHSYTLGDDATGPGGVDDHTHTMPPLQKEGVVGGLVFNSKRDEQKFKRQKAKGNPHVDLDTVNEDVPANFAGGDPNPNVAGLDQPPVKRKKKKDKFAGSRVFEVDSETFGKMIQGKPKFARFKKYMSLEDFPNVGQDIVDFARRKPKEKIILKDSKTGRMVFLRGFKTKPT